jgi:ArsR family transcriptional regulator
MPKKSAKTKSGTGVSIVDNSKLKHGASVMRALSHPVRLKIMEYIDKNKVINVNKIYAALKLEQSITSQHLCTLRKEKLVISKREGKFIYYSVNYERVQNVLIQIEHVFG